MTFQQSDSAIGGERRDWDSSQDAFVLTGSTANAAYEVGIMKRLLTGTWGKANYPLINPYCFAGTSVGALNAAVMVANADLEFEEALGRLESIWLDRIAVPSATSSTGVFRIRGDFTQYFNSDLAKNPFRPLLDIGSDFLYFTRETLQRLAYASSTRGTFADRAAQVSEFTQRIDYSPLKQLVREHIDTKKIAATSNPKKLHITAINWRDGSPRIFNNKDLGSTDGHESIIAAMCLPGVFPPETVDGLPYVDSSVLFETPLKPAIQARNCESKIPVVLHVVYADSSFRDIPLPSLSNTFATVYRLYQLALSRAVNADIQRAHTVNERIRVKNLFESVVAAAEDPVKSREDIIRTKLGEDAVPFWEQLHRDLYDRVSLTIHRHTPKEHIFGFELVQFERSTIQNLIQHGYEAARDHDCEESRCIIPQENTPPLYSSWH
jgi:predicted acylesterase/phospholipase RssA